MNNNDKIIVFVGYWNFPAGTLKEYNCFRHPDEAQEAVNKLESGAYFSNNIDFLDELVIQHKNVIFLKRDRNGRITTFTAKDVEDSENGGLIKDIRW